MQTISLDPVDRVYDEMRTGKVYIHQGMSCHTEFVEGLPLSKRRLLTTLDPKAMSLDEWAEVYRTDVSGLIEKLNHATPVGKRKELEQSQIDDYQEWIRLQDDTESEPIPLPEERTETQVEEPVKEKKASPSWPKNLYHHSPTCPKCGSSMVLRHGKYGDFYGCADYPECDGVMSLRKAKQYGFAVPVKALRRNRQGPPKPPQENPPTGRDDDDPNWWGKPHNFLGFLFVSVVFSLILALPLMLWQLGAINEGRGFGIILRILAIVVFLCLAYVIVKHRATVAHTLKHSVPLSGDKDRQHDNFGEWFRDKLVSWKTWIVMGSIVVSLMGTVGITEFIYEECGQSYGMAGYVLKTAGLEEHAFVQVEATNEFLDKMEGFVNTFGWMNPFGYDAYKTWIKAARSTAEALRLWAIAQNPQLAESVLSSEVTHIIDGDSLMLATGEEIRLAGIDAPEWYEDGGREAEKLLKGLTLHRVVDIRRIEQGYYGRIIADISVNGQSISAALIKAGAVRSLSDNKIVELDGAEGVVTKIASGRLLNGGYLLLIGDPINVFILPNAVQDVDPKRFNGMLVEVKGRLKLYSGEPEVVVKVAGNIIIKGG